MKNPNCFENIPWREVLKWTVRVAAPLALLHLVNAAIIRVPGAKTINRGGVWNPRSLVTEEEILMADFYRKADAYLVATGYPGLDIAHEFIAIGTLPVKQPREICQLPHHRPDFVVGQRGLLTHPQSAFISYGDRLVATEVGCNLRNESKRKQADKVRGELGNYQQLNLSDIEQLHKDLKKSPWETILRHMGNIF